MLDKFLQRQNEMLALIGRAECLAVDRINIPSAFDHRVRYSVWSSFRANLSHHGGICGRPQVAEQFRTVTTSE